MHDGGYFEGCGFFSAYRIALIKEQRAFRKILLTSIIQMPYHICNILFIYEILCMY